MTITRRKVLTASATAGIALSTMPWTTVATAQPVRTRYNATSQQGKQMLVKYERAVAQMMDNSKYPRSDPRSWDFQWYSHWIPGPGGFGPWPPVVAAKQNMLNQVFAGKPPNDPNRLLAEAMWDNCQAHGLNPNDPNFFQETYFCVWHRWYVYYFEEIVRGVLQDQSFTLPYWNYLGGTVADLSLPPEFLKTTSSLYRDNRNPWVNNGERIDKQNPGALNLDAFNEPRYIDSPNGETGFCPILDGNPHGLVHSFVGGLMNMGRVPYAARDPIFWMHHCNIDRLWESWNRLPGRTNPSWPDRPFPFANGQGKAVTALPKGASRVAQLKYQYDNYYVPKKVAPAPGPELLAAGPVAKVTKLSAGEPVTLAADRVRVALAPPPTALESGAPPKALAAPSTPTRRVYLVLGGVSAPDDADATYNVFFDLPENSTAATPSDRNYVGTLHFFGTAGHEDHGPSGHKTVFNVTETVKALQASAQLTATPSVTLVRQGGDPAKASKVVVRQVYLMEN